MFKRSWADRSRRSLPAPALCSHLSPRHSRATLSLTESKTMKTVPRMLATFFPPSAEQERKGMKRPKLHKIAIVLAAIAVGSAGISADALARGVGGGHTGGGFGGGHMGGGFGGGHTGGGFSGGHIGRGFGGGHTGGGGLGTAQVGGRFGGSHISGGHIGGHIGGRPHFGGWGGSRHRHRFGYGGLYYDYGSCLPLDDYYSYRRWPYDYC